MRYDDKRLIYCVNSDSLKVGNGDEVLYEFYTNILLLLSLTPIHT